MSKPPKCISIRRQENGRRAIQIFNTQMRDTFPLCGAKAKSTGLPCRRFAMANGRCDNHGGRTPSGNGWHRPVWPNGNAPDVERRLHRKLQQLEKAARARAARLRRMTDEERRQYEEWHKARPTTSAAERAEIKRMKQQGNAARDLMRGPGSKAVKSDPEYLAIVARIAEIRQALSALHEEHQKSEKTDEIDEITEGVFG